MNRHLVNWFVVTAALVVLVAATAPAFPMIEEEKAGTPEVSGEEPAGTATGAAGGEAAAVESILRAQEHMRAGRFSYDPDGRRDPFRSLFTTSGPDPRECDGILCMGVDDIDLAGIVQDAGGGNLAYFTGSDNRGYFLRVGDRVWDGTVIAIDSQRGSVTFRQKIDDPRKIKPYRDVVRRLVPEESQNE